jgi:DNA-binding MarR family transcriptional regulator
MNRRTADPSISRTGVRPAHADASLEEPVVRVLGHFRQIFNAVKTHLQGLERSAGIGGAQLWALSVIHDRPGIGVNDLASALGIRQSTASNLVKVLVQKRLAAATRSAADRRSVRLEVLAAGRTLLRRTPGPYHGVLPDALASLDPRRLARLERELAGLIEALGEDERAARTPLAQILRQRAGTGRGR